MTDDFIHNLRPLCYPHCEHHKDECPGFTPERKWNPEDLTSLVVDFTGDARYFLRENKPKMSCGECGDPEGHLYGFCPRIGPDGRKQPRQIGEILPPLIPPGPLSEPCPRCDNQGCCVRMVGGEVITKRS